MTELSVREREIVIELAEGRCGKQIGAKLGLTEGTVGMHRSNIAKKLGSRNLAFLTRYAIRMGWITP